ncbi:MAG: tetratricopeptide repeat protein [Acidobacteria bacterium]|nr:tetratricopeptide repeat protein [Acidobacteriota bacterium]
MIAVLPFQSSDGSPEARFRAESLSQSIVDRLARVRSISLRRGDVTQRYLEIGQDLSKVSADLSADAIVIGSLSNDGSMITTKIYRSADGSIIDESSYGLDKDSLLRIPEDISLRILGRVVRSVPSEDRNAIARPETTSTEAKRFYDLGRIYLRDRDKLDDAIENFVKAKDLDLYYAKAWAGLAEAYLGKSAPGAPRAQSPHLLFRDAKACAAQALEIDPFLPEAQYSLGLLALKYEWNWNEAEQSFRRALELDPDFVRARSGLINVLAFQSRFEEALQQAGEIRRRDPVSFTSEIELAQIYYRMGDFAKMAELLSELESKNPDNQRVAYLRTYQLLATGKFEDALAIIGPIYENEMICNGYMQARLTVTRLKAAKGRKGAFNDQRN